LANEAIFSNEADKILAVYKANAADKANELDELLETNKANAVNPVEKAKTDDH
jgi:hypothetical protein